MMFGWLESLFRKPSTEERTSVLADDWGVRCIRPDGTEQAVAWNDLQSAAIDTNDGGPFVEDVYFHLEGAEYGFHIPQAARGIDELVRRLTSLPGFDCEALAAAMCSTTNTRFLCWTARSGGGS
jgi:hypothetical protein